MKKELTWLGHNCWSLRIGSTRILVDPFLQTPSAPVKATDVEADYVFVSHGHSDHCVDALAVLKRTNATLVALAEIASWFGQRGVAKTEPTNIGGAIPLPLRSETGETVVALLSITPAYHSSTALDGTSGGSPCGFLLSIPQNGKKIATFSPDAEIKPMNEILDDAEAFSIYFACDTGYFEEMKLLGRWGVQVAVLPIGDRYTMGPSLSLDAINALNPQKVVPAHYNTWKPIAQNVQKWSDAVRKYTKAEPIVPTPGKPISFD